MNEGTFHNQVKEIKPILKSLDLFGDRIYRPKYPPNPAAIFRHLDYSSIWKKCFAESYFDYQLSDDSLIQFRVESFNPLCVSYVYYECPFVPSLPFPEFLRDFIEVEDWNSPHYRKQDFSDYYLMADKKEVVTPIRYDFSPSLYRSGLHPASHIHFGFQSNIRVGTKKLLKPISFVLFILRQVYPDYWGKFTGLEIANHAVRNIREHLDDVHNDFWNELDNWEMSLL